MGRVGIKVGENNATGSTKLTKASVRSVEVVFQFYKHVVGFLWIILGKMLFSGRLPENKKLFSGRFPENKKLFSRIFRKMRSYFPE